MLKSLSIYYKANIIKICLYGFICGMNLLLSGNTINFWLATYEIDAKVIGLFSCVALPYAFKYFIALFIDKSNLITKKNWLVISQLMLISTLIFISFLSPKQNLLLIAISGFLIALFSIIQDIVLNANRIKILSHNEQAAGSAVYNVGYRLGMLLSGAGVILASAYVSWSNIYLLLAFLHSILFIAMFFCYSDSDSEQNTEENISIWSISKLKNFIWVIIFILIYRLSDNMLVVMLNPFLLHSGYTAIEIGSISKFFGTIMVIIGGLLSGPIVTKLQIRNSLIYFSFFHIFGHMLFILLCLTGKNIELLYIITGYEALTGGMMMTAYFTLISNLCKGEYVATKYALLSSGIGLSRVIFPVGSGVIVDYFGWLSFFVFIVLISIITTIFTYFIPKSIY